MRQSWRRRRVGRWCSGCQFQLACISSEAGLVLCSAVASLNPSLSPEAAEARSPMAASARRSTRSALLFACGQKAWCWHLNDNGEQGDVCYGSVARVTLTRYAHAHTHTHSSSSSSVPGACSSGGPRRTCRRAGAWPECHSSAHLRARRHHLCGPS
jgi:hypothetical protein